MERPSKGLNFPHHRIALPLLLAYTAAVLLPLLSLAGGQGNQLLSGSSSSSPSDVVSASGDTGVPGPAGPPGPPVGAKGDTTCSLTQPWYRCCGPHQYDPFNDTCCSGFLVVGRPFAACCGREAFDVDVQGCCNGRVVNRSSRRAPLACCGVVGYDPTSFACCGTTVIRPSPVIACCGGQPYFSPEPIGTTLPEPTMKGDVGVPADGLPGSPSSSPGAVVCCGCRLYTIKGDRGQASCCGDVAYDTATQICCNGALHSIVGKRSPRCCGTALVDSSSSTGCCQGRPFTTGVFGPLCCPDGTLNSCCFYPQYNVTGCI